MPPLKVMPLLLTCITPFVIVSGAARADETRIILAENQPEDATKKKPQENQKEHPKEQHQTQPQHGPDQQKKTSDQQKAQELKKAQEHQQQQQHQAQDKTREEEKLKEHKTGTIEDRERHNQGEHSGQTQTTPPSKGQNGIGSQHGQDAERGRAEQAKTHDLKTPQQHAAKLPGVVRHDPTAEELRLKSQRDAHRADRDRLVAQQRQSAANEKTQAAVAERLKI